MSWRTVVRRPERPARMSLARGLLVTVLVLAVTYRLWRPQIGEFLVVVDPVRPADALVPLAGDRLRVVDAAALFRQGLARWFVVTDMWIDSRSPPLTYADAVAHQAEQHGVPAGSIVVAGGLPRTTYQEAVDLRRLAQARGWRSLIVLTSAYHTRRSRIILADVFRDSGITIMVRPAQSDWYRPASWWQTSDGRAATVTEYAKLLLYRLGHR